MPTFDKAGKDVHAQVTDLIKKNHGDLESAKVTVNVLYAYSKENGIPALKKAGYPCAAKVKIDSLQDRVEGKTDATISVDGRMWKDFTEARRVALLDHELQHLEVKMDKQGFISGDDIGRPKLKMRPHDWEVGGFDVIVNRHGPAAIEAETAITIGDHVKQLLMPWADGRKSDQPAAAKGTALATRKKGVPAGTPRPVVPA